MQTHVAGPPSATRAPSAPVFAPWRADDRDTVLALFAGNVPAHFAERERDDLVSLLDAPPGPYWLMRDADGTAIGCGGYAVDAKAPEIAWLCWGMVRADLHGRGFGRALLAHRLAVIAAHPAVREVRIETSQHSAGFFARHGFIERTRIADGFAPGYDLLDMALPLR